jgi:copper chaperone CopZ
VLRRSVEITVKKSLEAVPGVTKATVSFKDKTAIVTLTTAEPMLRA